MNIEAWHFLPNDRRLRYGTKEIVYPGRKITVDGPPILCHHGLHASRRLIDALDYSHGTLLCRVSSGGKIIEGKHKLVGTERTALWMADAEEMLRQFACLQAMSVSHLLDAVSIVTRDEIAKAANKIAWAAKRDAAWSAWYSAWIARDVMEGAARDAIWDEMNSSLERMAWMLCGPETAQFAPEAA